MKHLFIVVCLGLASSVAAQFNQPRELRQEVVVRAESYDVSASDVTLITITTTSRLAAHGLWNISPGEDGYVCSWDGLRHKRTNGRYPLPGAPAASLLVRAQGTRGWRPFRQGMVLEPGDYEFRCNDTDFNNEGSLTIEVQSR